jgi:hypothetical protein
LPVILIGVIGLVRNGRALLVDVHHAPRGQMGDADARHAPRRPAPGSTEHTGTRRSWTWSCQFRMPVPDETSDH